jgi:hypothetical protein
MARSMLIEARLPRRYWFWAIHESVIRMDMIPCRQSFRQSTQPPTSSTLPGGPDQPSIHSRDSCEGSFPLTESLTPNLPVSPSPISVPSASDLPERRYASLTTPFELFYGIKPDYRVPFKWGTVGYYRRCSDSGIGQGNFDTQSNVGLALGRSNQTNAMIFWDPATSRMNVSADYRLDPIASITSSHPNIVYDGDISPLVLRGGVNADKEPFPPGSKVAVLYQGEHLPGTILSVPLMDQKDYTIVLNDSPIHYLVPMNQLTGERRGPVFHMISVEPDSPVSTAPPKMPDWIQDNTHVTIHHDGRQRRGML